MSVVPLTLADGADGPRPTPGGPERIGSGTVVRTREEFDEGGGPGGNALLIQNLDVDQLSGRTANASYDLRIGAQYREHRSTCLATLADDETFDLRAREAIIIETEEYIRLPRRMFALLVPKVGLLQVGLSNTMSKVDPGYEGRLLVTLFNLGRKTVTLRRCMPFCSLCVLRVEDGATLYGKPGKRIEAETRRRWWEVPLDYVAKHQAGLSALNILATLILVVLLILQAGQ